MYDKVIEALSSVPIFGEVNRKTIMELAARASLKSYSKGKTLFYDKDKIVMVYIVISGFVSLYKTNDQGEKKVIFMLGHGELINEIQMEEKKESVNCEIFEDSVILAIYQQDFVRAMEMDFSLTKAVINIQTNRVRRLYRQLKNTSGSLRADKKVAAKLWKLSGDFGKTVEGAVMIDLDISITYLADMLGSKRETVSRQLKMLAEKELVFLKDNHFFIPDREKLANYFKSS